MTEKRKTPPLTPTEEQIERVQKSEQEPEGMSAFDLAVEAVEGTADADLETIQGVQILLRNAGVSEAKIAEVQANPSMAALIKQDPSLVARLAQMFPSAYAISYYEQRQQMGFGVPSEEIAPMDPWAAGLSATATTTSPTGAIEYPGGVIVDFASQTVAFPPTDASVLGSPAWLAQIPTWSEEKKQQWSQTLKQMGYIDSNKVDLVKFTDALAEYHKNRYLYGGGKPVDLSEGSQGVNRQDFGGLLDPAVLDTEVRQWHQDLYGTNDEPSEEELKRGRKRLSNLALRIARNKDMDPASAASVASARTEAKFRADPANQKWQDLEETDTSLHDSFVNLFQVLSQ